MDIVDQVNKELQELVRYRETLDDENKKEQIQQIKNEIREELKKQVIKEELKPIIIAVPSPEPQSWIGKILDYLDTYFESVLTFSETYKNAPQESKVNEHVFAKWYSEQQKELNKPIEMPEPKPVLYTKENYDEFMSLLNEVFVDFKAGKKIYYSSIGDNTSSSNYIQYDKENYKIIYYCFNTNRISNLADRMTKLKFGESISYNEAREIMITYVSKLIKERYNRQKRQQRLEKDIQNETFSDL